MRILLILLIVSIVFVVAARILIARQAAPKNLGLINGQLQPCPDSPNCVSSQAPQSDTEHFMPPIAYNSDTPFMMSQIVKMIASMPRAKIVKQSDNYLHAEFRSRTFGFVDDVEFLLDENNQVIHFRSAARMGKGDLGVNRKRMTEITQKLAK